MVACALVGMLGPRAHSPPRLKASAQTTSVIGRPLTVYEATRYGVALSVINPSTKSKQTSGMLVRAPRAPRVDAERILL